MGVKTVDEEDSIPVYITIANKTSGNCYHEDPNCKYLKGKSMDDLRESTKSFEDGWGRDACSWCCEDS